MNLVINSRFRPFTYDEMIKPLAQYKEVYDKVEQDYSNLAAQTEMWKNIANRENSPEAYEMYRRYSNDLEAVVSDFSKGMNINNRNRMMNMKKRYAQDIVPIANAYNTRKAQIEEQRKGRASGFAYDRDASTTSLDDYIKNPDLSFDLVDLNKVYKQSVDSFSALSKALTRYGNGDRVDRYHKTFFQKHGISMDQARKFIENIREGNIDSSDPTLRAIYDSVYRGTNVDSWSNEEAKSQVVNTILQGVNHAVGQTQLQIYEDTAAKLAAQAAQARSASPSYNPYNPNVPSFGTRVGVGNMSGSIKRIEDTARQLGLERRGNKYVIKNPSLPIVSGYEYGMEGQKVPTYTKYNIWHSDSRKLMTRHQFVNQGKTDEEKKNLNRAYTGYVERLNSIGANIDSNTGAIKGTGNSYTPASLYKVYEQSLLDNTPYKMNALDIPLSKSDMTEVLSTRLDNVISRGKAYEVQSSDGETLKVNRSRSLNQKELAEAQEKGNVHMYATVVKGAKGILITLPDKQYFIESQALPDYMQLPYHNFDRRLQMDPYVNEITRRLQDSNLSAAERQMYEEVLDNYRKTNGATFVSEFITGVTGTYNIPDFNVVTSSNKPE